MTKTSVPKWYTPEEAAEILRVSSRTVYTYIANGKLKSTKPAGRQMILETDLRAFICGETVAAES